MLQDYHVATVAVVVSFSHNT